MKPLFSTAPERELLRRARGEPGSSSPVTDPSDLARVAREHGVELLLREEERRLLPQRALAMELAHEALRAQVAEAVDALHAASVDTILLKGASVGERYYDPPWMRPCTDVDLLVSPRDLARAEQALVGIGYTEQEGPTGRFFRERHFHLTFFAHARLPLELHFIAYRGFGMELTASDLFEESTLVPELHPFVRAPSPARELVYLAVHAAAHRFERMGWLLDMVLLVGMHGASVFAEAERFARRTGFVRPLAAARALMARHFGVVGAQPASTRPIARAAADVALALAPPTASAIGRSATRLLYTLCLCDGPAARVRYVTRALTDKVVIPT